MSLRSSNWHDGGSPRSVTTRSCLGFSQLGPAPSGNQPPWRPYGFKKEVLGTLLGHVNKSAMHVFWQRLKNIWLVTGPGGLLATRLVTESGGLATNPPCDKPVEDYSTLHRGPRQGFVTEGPRPSFVAEGWTTTNPYFEALPNMYIRIYMPIHLSVRQGMASASTPSQRGPSSRGRRQLLGGRASCAFAAWEVGLQSSAS